MEVQAGMESKNFIRSPCIVSLSAFKKTKTERMKKKTQGTSLD